jgi:hypothetical protein
MSNTMQDISQYFEAPTHVAVKGRNKEHKFLFHDISKGDMDEIYRPVREAKGDAAATALANEQVVKDAIERVVSSESGEFFTADQITKLPVDLVNKIGAKVVAFMSGEDPNSSGDEVKPAGENAEEPEAPKA